MRIQHNIMAMSAYRNYTNNVSAMKKNLEKLSSGYKINRAGDDAAGLAISEKMRAQITGLETAQKNAKDGISLVQTAEGALTEVHDMLNRMVELATQSANGTYDNTTDRAQMQKEVNQLLEEIDRIADSSNFNGINLLDGSLGLNTDAFEVGGVAAGVAAVPGTPITGAASAGASTDADTHVSATAAGQNPSFSVDVADLEITVTGSTAQNATFTIGTKTVQVSLAGGTKATSVTKYTASDIADKIVAAFNSGTNAAGTANSAGAVKGLMFSAAVGSDGHTINFTYEGVANAGGTAVDGSATLGSTAASAFNALYGGGFSAAASVTGKLEITSGRVNCDILNAKEAVAAGDTQRGGISFTLASSAIADGNKITIDGKEFTIRTTGTGTFGSDVIDLRGVASDELLRQTVLQLSNKTTDNFTIHTASADGGKIHLEQTAESFNGGNGKLYGYDELSKLVSVTGGGTPAKGAGTILDVTAANVKAGNVLKIGDGSNAVEIKFGASDTTATAIKAKIEAAGFTVDIATGTAASGVASGATRFIIRSNDLTATKGPQILGKGLTLQIGDTSDDFNQLNVAVQDMHAENLGIGNLDISTEEAAQAAIKKIKDAINTVSDVRGTLGATQNRLDHTINNLSVMTENIQDAESTIRDVDVAEEMMAYTKNNILIQSAQAMLAQANQVPQGVLQLLQ